MRYLVKANARIVPTLVQAGAWIAMIRIYAGAYKLNAKIMRRKRKILTAMTGSDNDRAGSVSQSDSRS